MNLRPPTAEALYENVGMSVVRQRDFYEKRP